VLGQQQQRRGSAEHVVVGCVRQADVLQPARRVAQQRFGPAIAAFHQFLDRQAGEELGEREVVTGELAGIIRKALARQVIGDPHHLPW
jgi:hypothetical protein